MNPMLSARYGQGIHCARLPTLPTCKQHTLLVEGKKDAGIRQKKKEIRSQNSIFWTSEYVARNSKGQDVSK